MAEARGHQATVHLALEDSTGDSAILEYINGKLVIHHGRQYQVMTNDPPYDQQLALLAKMKKGRLRTSEQQDADPWQCQCH